MSLERSTWPRAFMSSVSLTCSPVIQAICRGARGRMGDRYFRWDKDRRTSGGVCTHIKKGVWLFSPFTVGLSWKRDPQPESLTTKSEARNIRTNLYAPNSHIDQAQRENLTPGVTVMRVPSGAVLVGGSCGVMWGHPSWCLQGPSTAGKLGTTSGLQGTYTGTGTSFWMEAFLMSAMAVLSLSATPTCDTCTLIT